MSRVPAHRPPQEDIAARGGKPWDTVKPLGCYFADLTRVVLIDDSDHKAHGQAEADNMLLVPK